MGYGLLHIFSNLVQSLKALGVCRWIDNTKGGRMSNFDDDNSNDEWNLLQKLLLVDLLFYLFKKPKRGSRPIVVLFKLALLIIAGIFLYDIFHASMS